MYLIIFYFGACLGSFTYCLLQHIQQHNLHWKQRSHCDHCQHCLNFLDLFPLFSQIYLRFKCRYCHHQIASSYFWIEILFGLYACFIYLAAQYSPIFSILEIFIFYLHFYNLIVMAIHDLMTHSVPLILEIICITTSTILYNCFTFSLNSLVYTSWLTLLLLCYYKLHPNMMGIADIILIACLSPLLPSNLISWFLFLAAICGILWLFILKLFKHISITNYPLPFIPCLVCSFNLCFFIN